MQTLITRWGINLLAVACLGMLFLIFTNRDLPSLSIRTIDIQNFKTIFLSIILEALPFILLGVIVAALLNVFVSEETVRNFVPNNPVLGVLFGCLLGIILPLCECGMIPIVRRLIQKGMPLYVGIIYILAGPIINPVVFASTFAAFRSRPEMAYSRMALAFVVAAIIGIIIYRFVKSDPLKPYRTEAGHHFHKTHHQHGDHSHANHNDAGHNLADHDHQDHNHEKLHDLAVHSHEEHNHEEHNHEEHNHDAHHHHHHPKQNRAFTTMGHASDEFFEMGKYLMFGAMITAIIQTFMSRESLVVIGEGELISHLFMMGFAFILSICSTSDAFIASSFITTFSTGSLLTFLVFGPMLDLKNTLMLMAVFRTRFVLLLMGLITVVTLVCSLIFQQLIFS